MNIRDIEAKAAELHEEIWARRSELWRDGAAKSRLDVLNVEIAAELCGYSYHEFENLGGTDRSVVAGIFNKEKRRILVVTAFAPDVVRFTAGHELGHVVLKHEWDGLHKDRPIGGLSAGYRDPVERDADRFAAMFFMPRCLVYKAYETRFGSRPFVLNETTAYHLKLAESQTLLSAASSRACALALAKAERWNDRRFGSLAQVFRVSPLSMAIQLEHFGLVSTPSRTAVAWARD
jgi:Zn-dependent peptidase ImmA (M78 family)